MIHPQQQELARLLVGHSTSLKRGEKCLIQSHDVPEEMVEALIDAVYEAGACPVVDYRLSRLNRALVAGADQESLTVIAESEAFRMEKMDAFIGIRGYENPREQSDLPDEQNRLEAAFWATPVHHKIRVPRTKWVVLRYPTPGMAAMAGTSTRSFEEFFFSVTCGVDYEAMRRAMEGAREYLEKARDVHISGPGTNLRFSIEGLGVVPCFGERNIPDGEIYTAPVRDSVEGSLSYNAPSTCYGFTYRDIQLTFRQGKIVEAAANDSEKINTLFDMDGGARYIGEFAMGCNPHILTPMDETLFDEKIAGSFHFTPGNAYKEADNGNKSSLHWDLVCIQRPEFGGGTIEMDGELIRKDGLFVHPAFTGLNPEHLTR
jgi:aminopeptidase